MRHAAPVLRSPFVAIFATAAGVGWLYLLRHFGALDAGPGINEALPLQRLAGEAAQPLLRLVVAWLPAGIVAGLAMRAAGVGRAARGVVAFAGCALLLLVAGAASDALTANETVRAHVGSQPERAATWVAAGLMALGAVIAP
jgi:hypothetical protein